MLIKKMKDGHLSQIVQERPSGFVPLAGFVPLESINSALSNLLVDGRINSFITPSLPASTPCSVLSP